MGTTLHELGHAVYDLGISAELPFILRRASHTLTTEAIAMLFGRLSLDATWIADMDLADGSSVDALRDSTTRELRAQMLIFTRFVLVMAHFERGMYADPGQDLNELWWSLIERFQGLERPQRSSDAADYAAKKHIVGAPVYYHNYLLGECFASQIHESLRHSILNPRGSYAGNPGIGPWLTEHIFRPGALLNFDALAKNATGQPVSPEAFAAQYVAVGAAG